MAPRLLAAIPSCRPPGAYSGLAAGINRADGVKQREASENVERSVSPRLKPSLLCEPNRFPDSGAILHLNRGLDPFPRLLFVVRS